MEVRESGSSYYGIMLRVGDRQQIQEIIGRLMKKNSAEVEILVQR
jgi:hypothetical protein